MRLLAWAHRWLGLPLSLLLLVQAVTGAIVLFKHEANDLLHHAALTADGAPPLPLQTLVSDVLRDRPDARLLRIDYPETPQGTYILRLDRGGTEWRLSVDPGTGQVKREATVAGWPIEWLFDLHYTLLLGKDGQIIAGLSGLGLLILSITGPVLWWRGRPRGRGLFAVASGGGKARFLRDLHRLTGILAALPLAILSFTGLMVALKIWTAVLVGFIAPVSGKPTPIVAARADQPFLPLDRIIATAQADRPGASIRNIRFPGGNGRVVLVFLEDEAASRPDATWQVWVNAYDGTILGRYTNATMPAGSLFMEWMLPIHTGSAGGLALRLFWCLSALGLAGLLVTGAWGWLARRDLSPRTLRVAATDPLSYNVRGLRLRRPFGLPVQAEPGAHIDLYLQDGLIRQYSLTNAPGDRSAYAIAVQLEPAGRGGSRATHALRVGDRVRVGPPRNSFPLSRSATHHLLLAAGIGITPIIAMAEALARTGSPFVLHYATRDTAGVLFADRLSRLGDRVHLYPADAVPRRRLHIRAMMETAPPGTHVQACGPARFLAEIRQVGSDLGWDGSRLHLEGFTATGPDSDAQPFSARLPDGRIIQVPANQTLAQALTAAGLPVPVSCGQGLCGTCTLPLRAGHALHHDQCLSPQERETLITPCCSRGTGEIAVG